MVQFTEAELTNGERQPALYMTWDGARWAKQQPAFDGYYSDTAALVRDARQKIGDLETAGRLRAAILAGNVAQLETQIAALKKVAAGG